VNKLTPIILTLFLSVTGTSFAAEPGDGALGGGYADLFKGRMRGMAQELTDKALGFEPKNTMVVVTTFVPVGEYSKSDYFGKLCAEQMLVGLSEKEFRVYDLRKTKQIFVKNREGFFALSDRVEDLSPRFRTELILVGSYALVSSDLIINAMLIKADDGEVVSSSTQTMGIADDEFLGPIVTPLLDTGGNGIHSSRNSLKLREPIVEGVDSSSKKLNLKISKLSSDISKNIFPGDRGRTLIVATYVDLDDLNRTNGLGRYITEYLMEKLYKSGFKVVEVRTAKDLSVSPFIGEMALTRDTTEMMNKHSADAMVVGTYQKVGNIIRVSTRMIVAENQEVVSVASTEIPVDPDDKFIQSLLRKELVRISSGESVEGY